MGLDLPSFKKLGKSFEFDFRELWKSGRTRVKLWSDRREASNEAIFQNPLKKHNNISQSDLRTALVQRFICTLLHFVQKLMYVGQKRATRLGKSL